MRDSTRYVLIACAIALAWIVMLAFLKAATDEPSEALEVSRKFWLSVRRGDLVTKADGRVYRVKAVKAPKTLIVRRER